MVAKGRQCKQIDGCACTKARNGSGEPCVVNRACDKCREWRCKSHCRCGRLKLLKGRNQARPGSRREAESTATEARAAVRAAAAPDAVPLVQIARPSGRPSPLSFDVFTDSSWMDAFLGELKKASSVQLASFIFDDPECSSGLARRLKASRSSFSCDMVVDKSHFESRTSVYQRPRLLELKTLGANVSLADGFDTSRLYGPRGKKGIMHLKAVVLDGRVAFTGGCNMTKSSRGNRELTFRVTGPPVKKILQAILAAMRSGEKL